MEYQYLREKGPTERKGNTHLPLSPPKKEPRKSEISRRKEGRGGGREGRRKEERKIQCSQIPY